MTGRGRKTGSDRKREKVGTSEKRGREGPPGSQEEQG